jgi:mono/diheme cytochrome c family protein
MANTAEAVDVTHETSEAAASSGRPRERRLQTCIACHGSGELPMRANSTLLLPVQRVAVTYVRRRSLRGC